MKLRTGEPWMPAPEYSRSLKAITINLLVRDIEQALVFQREVLGAEVVYSDPDFAVLRGYGGEWIMHADHAYAEHPWAPYVAQCLPRGAGVELRLHGRDPDDAEAAAQQRGFRVLSPATDKRHGLRETYLVDADGYVWVADTPARQSK